MSEIFQNKKGETKNRMEYLDAEIEKLDAEIEILDARIKKRKRDHMKYQWEKYQKTPDSKGIFRKTVKSGGKVYASHNKRYAHGGKVSGRKATYKY